MTQEEKAKAYDEALALMQDCIPDENGLVHVRPEDIFPELAESEDKMMVKFIKKQLSNIKKTITENHELDVKLTKAIDWLEKQSESDGTKAKMFLINKGYPIDANGVFPTYEEMYNIIKEGLEYQDALKPIDKVEPKFNIGDTMRTLKEASKGITDGMPVVVSIDNEYYHCTNELIAIKDQDDYEFPPINIKQNLADKVEPKFKVGDWVVSPYNNVAYIESITETKYNLQGKDSYHEKMYIEYVDRCWHLWTIQDAKDGDVLVSRVKQPFIFKNYDEDTDYVYAYCGITNLVKDNGFYINNNEDELWTCCSYDDDIYPATKEQCDLLFQKMTETGYEWDAEKKVLDNIFQNEEQ